MPLGSLPRITMPLRLVGLWVALALCLPLVALSGCKKQAEVEVKNEEQLRAVTEQGMQRMMQDQQRGPGGQGGQMAPPPGPPSK